VAHPDELNQLQNELEGDFYTDTMQRSIYATDASSYREMPLAVAIPKTKADLKKLIRFARTHKTSLIPRTAGSSLAGQVVGNGIVVDVSRHFTNILETKPEQGWVRVEPGVIRNELNMHLEQYGLFFAPETSTANRAMIGGMVGNNSCGSNSVVYGSTREHLIEVKALLADGAEAVFGPVDKQTFDEKCEMGGMEGELYRTVRRLLSPKEVQDEIRKEFPKPSIPRRNTGYAVDYLIDSSAFRENGEDFNFCKMIAGSEGTLCFLTEIKLHVEPLPPAHKGVLCAHFNSVDEALRANLVALRHNPSASELMDHYVLECTKDNIEQRKNRFFVQGEPGAILMVELTRETEAEIDNEAEQIEEEMKADGLGYHFPLLKGEDIPKAWKLRKAGLGVLNTMPGDAKPVAVIEDTAVDVQDLPAYIRAFNDILAKHDLYCVHYAHAATGELHLRPILNLKSEEGTRLFRVIAEEIAKLVKKYKGSLSGEHGDGRLRGEFISYMAGENNYELFRKIKDTWDPDHIFNPGKITDTPPMDTKLRYSPGQETPRFDTAFDWSKDQGILRAAELCNGTGECRKTELSGGTMCPSYMATRDEKDTTRARANILREFLTDSDQENRFDHEEIHDVMDLCLSCKGCKNECPSNVDVAKLKAEFQHQYYKANGVPLRTRLIGNFAGMNKMASLTPRLYNFFFKTDKLARLGKKVIGFHPDRSMPLLHETTFRKWFNQRHKNGQTAKGNGRKVVLFCDEFTDYNDTPIGKSTVRLLEKLGYEVIMPEHEESGRSFLSKGLLDNAQKLARHNVAQLADYVSEDVPIIGIEPSAILTLRDEYPELVSEDLKEKADHLAQHTYIVDEFIGREIDQGRIKREQFTDEEQLIKLHGHCHQKALSTLVPTKKMLELPRNYKVHMIPSGCCGMAGSFGYEKEHYDLSMKIGELVLFPTVRKTEESTLIAAPGTSCRHQIHDGTGRQAYHTVEILEGALRTTDAVADRADEVAEQSP
jgi:FAD/FMN-containing dehydrogenase/Fe-S oxidoreductase